MALLGVTARDNTFERVRALTGIARVILDIRLFCGLLVTVWISLKRDDLAMLLLLCAAMAWLLLVLLRWRTIGWVLCTHPAVLAIDAGLCFAALVHTDLVSPVLLLAGTGALLTGLCLDRRGAWYFSPCYLALWLLVYAMSPPSAQDDADLFLHAVVIPSLLIGALFLGAGIRDVMLRAADVERDRRQQLRTAGVAEERARLAREMHDSLTKSLHGIAMLADTLPRWMDKDPEKGKAQAVQLSELIRNASRESRAVILAMRRADANATITELIRAAAERWKKTTGRALFCELVGEPSLPTESAYELSAILDEALENVRRHTEAQVAVWIRLHEDAAWVLLEVIDDGPGLAGMDEPGAEKPGHFGVVGMRERAARVGGRLSIDSSPNGTTVTARLPASLPEELVDDEMARVR